MDFITTQPRRSSIILGICVAILLVCAKILPVLCSTARKLCKVHRQTIDGKPNDKISSLETLSIRLVKPRELALSQSQGAYTVDTDACSK